ncbi:MAG: Glu-tRNA(Gln) amidotransferase GatDE subunit D, partial [Candidatus Methanoplasma sp.]|nr:Glu-tRNA(Gln) amidotransferase GatDE subunit D [Candidatus Methanoplasma sp.]
MRYSPELSKMLEAAGAREGSRISFITDGKEYTGILMSNKDSCDPDVIVIKMRNSYNAGFRVGKDASIKVLEQPLSFTIKETRYEPKKGLPNLVLIGTGGTIGSQADEK